MPDDPLMTQRRIVRALETKETNIDTGRVYTVDVSSMQAQVRIGGSTSSVTLPISSQDFALSLESLVAAGRTPTVRIVDNMIMSYQSASAGSAASPTPGVGGVDISAHASKIASASALGHIRVDNDTVRVDSTGVLKAGGTPVSVFDFIPRSEWTAIRAGSSTYNCTTAINQAIEHARTTGRNRVLFDGKLFWTDGGHIIYDNLHFIGLGMGATMLRLRNGIPIDTSMFITEHYYGGMQQTIELGVGTFGFSVEHMTLHGNKQGIARVLTATSGTNAIDATTINVDSTAGFTAPGRLRIDKELITYTGMTGTSFTGCERGDFRSFPAAYADDTPVLYFPLWGGVGLGLYGGQYVLEGVRVENFRNMGVVTAYDRKIGGTFNYQNSRDPENSAYADLPDGDSHCTMHDIEILNNQLINLCYLGPHDSHISHFTIVKDGDDLPGEKYYFPVAGIYIAGTGNPDSSIDSGFGSQFSDGHVWGNHSYGIWQNTGGVLWHNVQSEGAHVQFRSSSGNAMGTLRLFGASGGRASTGAWLENQGDSLSMRIESHDYAGVVLGSFDESESYGGGYIEIDGYTNNPSATTLSAAITDTQTTIPYTLIVNDPGEANYLPFAHNPDNETQTVCFGVPFGADRGPLTFTVENEEIKYDYYDGTNFYGCVRGYNGTVALAHASGKNVFGVLNLVRGKIGPSFDPTRGTLITRRHYNYEPVRTRQLESYLRRGEGLTYNEKRQAFAVGATPAVTDLATKHKFMVSVTETEPKNDYAVASLYGHMLRDTDAPTHTYHGLRSYIDTTFTDKTTKEVRAVTAEVNMRSLAPAVVTDVVGLFAGAYTSAPSTAAVTRMTGVTTLLTHAGSGVVGSGINVDVATPVGAGVYTNLYGVRIANMGRTGTTLSKAIHITSQAGSATNYALYSDGGESRLYSGYPGVVPLKVWGHFSQTANLLEFWNRDTNARMSYVDKDGAWNGVTGSGGTSTDWADVTGKPTTLAGYGITDAASATHTHTFASLTSKPTTLAGYGITDAASATHAHAFTDLTSHPTTLAGYGITDAADLGANSFTDTQTITTTNRALDGIRNTASTNVGVSISQLRAMSTGTPADGFGALQTWAMGAGVTSNVMASAGGVRDTADTSGAFVVSTYLASTATERMRIDKDGKVGWSNAAPSSRFHLRAGGASAGNSPLKFTSGTLMTAVEDGTIEYNGGFFYTQGGVRTAFGSGAGTVTSVAMSVPSFLSVTGSPVTSSGTLAVTLANQSANLVFAGPATGASAAPTFRALVAADIPDLDWAKITSGTPTTLAGYGITDAASSSHTHTFASLTSKPTTLAGYGITDAASSSHTHTFASLTSKPTTLSGYGITDAASSSHTHSFASLTSLPTTLAGYGITDAASASHTHTFASLTSKPTTLAGYGITDAAPAFTAQVMNTVYAGPASGANALPAFRALVANDIPNLDWAKITTGKPTTLAGYGITDAAGLGANSFTDAQTITKNVNAGFNGVSVSNTNPGTTSSDNSGYAALLVTTQNLTGTESGGVLGVPNNFPTALLRSAFQLTSLSYDHVDVRNAKTGADIRFIVNSTTVAGTIDSTGRLGLGVTPAAVLHLKAGTATANTAPLKFTAGTVLTVIENGTIEYSSSGFFYSHGGARVAFGAATSVPWSGVSGTPTTLAGYGITDAASLTHTHAFSSLTSIPTTLAGYGITDAVLKAGDTLTGTFTAPVNFTDPVAAARFINATITSTETVGNALAVEGMRVDTRISPSTGITHTGLHSSIIAIARNMGAGTISNSTAVRAQIVNTTTGAIGSAFGFYLDNPTSTTGTITNVYGVYVDTQKQTGVTNAYAFYQAGSADTNYLAGKTGIGTVSPTALLHFKAGTATANSAPIKFTSGVLLTTPEAGAIEFNASQGLMYTNTLGARQTVAVLETAQSYTALPTFAAGASFGLTGTTDPRIQSAYFPRTGNLSSPIMLDYTDEFALLTSEPGRSVNFSTAPNVGTGAEMFVDDANDTRWNVATSPFPLVIEMDMLTNPIQPKASAVYRLGITFRTTPTLPMDYTVEVWDTSTSAYVSQQTGTITSAIANAFLLPSFGVAVSGSLIYKMRLTLTGTNPVAAIMRIQRIILYHDTHTWDPWHLHRLGGTLFGNMNIHTTAPTLAVSGVTGNVRAVALQTSYVNRWQLLATDDPESGSDTGSDFAIGRYTDAGAFIAYPFKIARATGYVQLTAANVTLGNEGASPVTATMRAAQGTGYNLTGADLVIVPGGGTGTGGSGDTVFRASGGSAADIDSIVAGTVTTVATATGGVTSLPFAHTVSAGWNRVLIVAVSARGTPDATGVTYGGVAMTKHTSVSNGSSAHAELWWLANPPVGTANVVITFAVATRFSAGAMNFTGVRPDAPFGTAATATGTTGTATVNVASTAGDMVVDAVSKIDSTEQLTTYVGAGQTSLWTNTSANATASNNSPGGSSREAGATTVTMSWSWGTPNRAWAIVAAPLRPGTTANAMAERARIGRNGLKLSGSLTVPLRTITSSETLLTTDYVVLVDATSANIIVTLPTAVGAAGRMYFLKRIDGSAFSVTLATTSGEMIDQFASGVLTFGAQWAKYAFVSNGTNWLLVDF